MDEFTREISERGQVTIPIKVRKSMGLEEGDQIAFIEVAPGEYVMKKVDAKKMRGFLLIDSKVGYDSTSENE